jgi:hypothetical protein
VSPKQILIDVAAGTIVAKEPQESSGDIHLVGGRQVTDVIYDRRRIHEDRDQAGRPVLHDLYPSVRTWKVADILRQ